jgi:hypothetical protein
MTVHTRHRTVPRRLVYETLRGRECSASVAQVYVLLRGTGSWLGLTGICRVLRDLAGVGLLQVFPGEERRYRICAQSPHPPGPRGVWPGERTPRPRGTRLAGRPGRGRGDFVANAQRNGVYGVCGGANG